MSFQIVFMNFFWIYAFTWMYTLFLFMCGGGGVGCVCVCVGGGVCGGGVCGCVCVCFSFPNIKTKLCLTMSTCTICIQKMSCVTICMKIYWNPNVKRFLICLPSLIILLKLKVTYTSSIYFVFRR